ncbi:isoprenylcysteine carboxyl methyltransferase family protein [Archangium primigenium]|uniref:isoprenylcysteine carboxyl methyltransferase family protein n=1 Tax=Melittangium TaxID=44 RepID=UPI00195C7E2F|nr:isoprenylcysteine carboxyl methyltransferase family protein [Archangium primigenium]MBM7114018.1 isoprenylcysteine carboxyl methyltransferase family protein [Archangium primigenium]
MELSDSARAYLFFLGLIGVERVVELVLSTRNARRALAAGGREVGQGHYRVMTVLHTAFLVSCAAEVVGWPRAFPGVLGWVALGGAVLAQALRYWAITTLGERWNTRILFIPGARPVTSGPYRFVRHPNYVAVILEMACIPLIHGAYLTALVFSVANAALLVVRIRAEEAALGPEYQRAFGARPRFVPGGAHES